MNANEYLSKYFLPSKMESLHMNEETEYIGQYSSEEEEIDQRKIEKKIAKERRENDRTRRMIFMDEGQPSGKDEPRPLPPNEELQTSVNTGPFRDMRPSYKPRKGTPYKNIPRYNRKVPYEYQPQINETDPIANRILDLDCCRDPSWRLNNWASNLGIEIGALTTLNSNKQATYNLIKQRTTGNVRSFLEEKLVDDPEWAETRNGQDLLGKIQTVLLQEFCGTTTTDEKSEALKRKEAAKAKYILMNLQICNICDFAYYSCEFSRWYYALSTADRPQFIEMFFNKIPPPMGTELAEGFKIKCENNEALNTLGGRINYVKDEIMAACQRRTEEKEKRSMAALQFCCDPESITLPGNYGCRTTTTRRSGGHRKHRRKRRDYDHRRKKRSRRKGRYFRTRPNRRRPFRRYSYKRYNRSSGNKRQRYFRKRRPGRRREYGREARETDDKTLSKGKYCPKGKTNCTCWLCQEKGHYASECPKRKEKQDRVQILEQIYKIGFEPIEEEELLSDASSDIYYLDSSESDSEDEYTYDSEEETTDGESEYSSESE